MKKALLIIDTQNDYLPTGKYPLWNLETTLTRIIEKIELAKKNNDLILLIQHISPKGAGFFAEESEGVKLIPAIVEQIEQPIVIEKRHASAFFETNLDAVLKEHHIEILDIVGMMTQNCVLFTALSKEARQYQVNIYSDCCTSVDAVIHAVAIRGLSQLDEVNIINS